MKDLSIENYIKILSSSEPTPGGGSVAALDCAYAMSLVLMVSNLTIGKKKYEEYEKLIKDTIKNSIKLQDRFMKLMEEDVKDFENIEKVFKMPKETSEEIKKRNKEMAKACKICCKTPISIINNSLDGINIILSILGKSNISAISDLGVAAENLLAGAKSAWLTILMNLKYIDDEIFIKKCYELRNNKLKEIEKLEKTIFKNVEKTIR